MPGMNLFEIGMPILARADPKYKQAAVRILTELGRQKLSRWAAGDAKGTE